jgi:hypothetical protein
MEAKLEAGFSEEAVAAHRFERVGGGGGEPIRAIGASPALPPGAATPQLRFAPPPGATRC